MIHNKGFKAKKDRAKCAENYASLCRYFHVKPLKTSELAKLNEQQFYNLCEDIFNARSRREKARYAEHEYGVTNPQYRLNPLAFKWFYFDMMRFTGAQGFRRFVLALTSPFRYPGFLKRSKKARAAKMDKEIAEIDGVIRKEEEPSTKSNILQFPKALSKCEETKE